MFTPAQQGKYRPLVKSAWMAHCARAGGNPFDHVAKDAWYRGELLTVLGVPTTAQADKVKDFDEVMAHFAVIAGDEYWIAKTARAAEDRMRWQIRRILADISKLEGKQHDWGYVVAIYRHMNLPADMADCPAQLLWKVFQALDMHARRHRYDSGHHGEVHAAAS